MAQTVRQKALIRQARENGRPSEDDVAQERLGWRGQKGRRGVTMMTEEEKLQTPSALDPGHRLDADHGPPRYPDEGRTRLTTSCGSGADRRPSTRKKDPAGGAAQSLWDERTQRVVELVPPAPMPNRTAGSGGFIKIFIGRRPGRDGMRPRPGISMACGAKRGVVIVTGSVVSQYTPLPLGPATARLGLRGPSLGFGFPPFAGMSAALPCGRFGT